jgi:hypothetical protein
MQKLLAIIGTAFALGFSPCSYALARNNDVVLNTRVPASTLRVIAEPMLPSPSIEPQTGMYLATTNRYVATVHHSQHSKARRPHE